MKESDCWICSVPLVRGLWAASLENVEKRIRNDVDGRDTRGKVQDR